MALTHTVNLIGMDAESLREWVQAHDERPYTVAQLLKWLYQHRCLDFDAMTNLSKSFREKLFQHAHLKLPHIKEARDSQDGTRKWLLELDDGAQIECVSIPGLKRQTLCISSQAGCPLRCRFCATGTIGFKRNLSAAEIVAQVLIAERGAAKSHTNLVLMGMGEPLLNYDAVISALRLLTDPNGFGYSPRKMTLSTAGMVPQIKKLKRDCRVSLAVSLHAATDEIRSKLVPLNRKYPIKSLMEACRDYIHDTHDYVTFEYTMLDGVNDSEQQLKALIVLLQGLRCKVNLIPYNPVAGLQYRCSPWQRIERFRDKLMRAGVMTTVRMPKGQDIAAACGQLVAASRTMKSEISS